MTQEEFFLKITSKSKTTKEKIIEILKARGFFICKSANGNYYMSGSASSADCSTLNQLLKKHSIGYIEEISKDEINNRKYHWANEKFGNIIINDDVTISNAIDLFLTIQGGSEALYTELSWDKFRKRLLNNKFDTMGLEPYIAFYVKAINCCGIFTNDSCDGNHNEEDRNILYTTANYPTSLLHDILWNELILKLFKIEIINPLKIQITKENKFDIYYKIFRIANFIYHNREKILSFKKRAINEVMEKYKDNRFISKEYRLKCCIENYKNLVIDYREELKNGMY